MCEELSASSDNWNVIVNTVNALVDGKPDDNLLVYSFSILKIVPMQKYPGVKVKKNLNLFQHLIQNSPELRQKYSF